jgi:hypothetical protein
VCRATSVPRDERAARAASSVPDAPTTVQQIATQMRKVRAPAAAISPWEITL